MYYVGDSYISHFVFEPEFPSLVSVIEPIKVIKFVYFVDKFYGFAWKEKKLPLVAMLINVYKAHKVNG